MWTAFKEENEHWASLKEFPGLGRKLRILGIFPNLGGCSFYRLIMPLKKLGELFPNCLEIRTMDNPLGIDTKTGKADPNWKHEDMHWADLIMVSNISNFGGPYTARVIGLGLEFGKFVHMDTDDLLTDLYKEHKLYNVYKENKLDEITKYIYAHSHLVTVTQTKFAERIKPYIGNVLAVLKNTIDFRLPCWNAPKIPSKICRFGWAAGVHHDPDVKIFAGVPHLVNQKVGRENLIWTFCGYPPPPENGKKDWQHDTWRDYIGNIMKGNKGQPNYQVKYALPPDSYGYLYSDMDVAIAPLALNNFNDSKSDIKVAEAGRYSMPLVATDIGCYSDTIINGETGYLINANRDQRYEWADKLAKLAKDRHLREKMGANLKKITDLHFDINNVAFERLELYLRIFQELNFKFK